MPDRPSSRPGGIPPIDPTKNVLDLVDAESRHRDSLRDADTRYQNDMREAETRRLNELAAQKQTFDLELAKVLRANQDAASTLLATQLKEVKNDLSDRTAKLEQFRWETGGKSSVADPAIAEALKEMTITVRGLMKADDHTSGRRELIGWGAAAVMMLAAIGTVIVAVLNYAK